jgi:hypothetical protein
LSFRKKVLLTLFCFPIVTHQQLQIPAAKFIRNMYLILIHYIWNSIIIVKKIIQILRCSQEKLRGCLEIKISNKMQNQQTFCYETIEYMQNGEYIYTTWLCNLTWICRPTTS